MPIMTTVVGTSHQIVCIVCGRPIGSLTSADIINSTDPRLTLTCSNCFDFAPLAAALSAFSPAMGPRGATIFLPGWPFAQAVYFNGVASPSVTPSVSPMGVYAVVPSTANTGPVTLDPGFGIGIQTLPTFTVTIEAWPDPSVRHRTS